MLQKIGFREQISNCKYLSNRSHKVTTIVEAFITSIWCGSNCFSHAEVTRHDVAPGKIFDWDNIPAQDGYKRFFSKFDQATNQSDCGLPQSLFVFEIIPYVKFNILVF